MVRCPMRVCVMMVVSQPQLWCCVCSPPFPPHHRPVIISSTPLQVHLVSLAVVAGPCSGYTVVWLVLPGAGIDTFQLLFLPLNSRASPLFSLAYSSVAPHLQPACFTPPLPHSWLHQMNLFPFTPTPVLSLGSALGSSSCLSPNR